MPQQSRLASSWWSQQELMETKTESEYNVCRNGSPKPKLCECFVFCLLFQHKGVKNETQ